MNKHDDSFQVAELLIQKYGAKALYEAEKLAKIRHDSEASTPERDWGRVLKKVEEQLS